MVGTNEECEINAMIYLCLRNQVVCRIKKVKVKEAIDKGKNIRI